MGYQNANKETDLLLEEVDCAARGHLLVVDDDRDIRSAIRLILESLGVRVTLAARGEEALTRMTQDSFDLVLLDVSMPGIGGLETLERMQRGYPRTRVLMMSATPHWHPKEMASLGAGGFLRKPFRMSDLLQAVESAVRRTVPSEEVC
jgi:CheY-like chemotaxis protein